MYLAEYPALRWQYRRPANRCNGGHDSRGVTNYQRANYQRANYQCANYQCANYQCANYQRAHYQPARHNNYYNTAGPSALGRYSSQRVW